MCGASLAKAIVAKISHEAICQQKMEFLFNHLAFFAAITVPAIAGAAPIAAAIRGIRKGRKPPDISVCLGRLRSAERRVVVQRMTFFLGLGRRLVSTTRTIAICRNKQSNDDSGSSPASRSTNCTHA